MFHSFFKSLARSRYLSLFSHSFSSILWSAGTAKSTILQSFFFYLLIIIRSGLLVEIMWSVCISKSHWSLCVSFSRTGAGLRMSAWSDLNFLQISQWITLPTQSCQALYSFCANLLHSLIMWLMVSSLSPHCLHLLFCCVLSVFTLIWLVLMACEMLFISRLKTPMELFFFPFLFLSFCHSVIYRFVSIVSDCRNQSSFVFFYVVFKSLYGFVNAVFDAGNSSSSLFSWYI